MNEVCYKLECTNKNHTCTRVSHAMDGTNCSTASYPNMVLYVLALYTTYMYYLQVVGKCIFLLTHYPFWQFLYTTNMYYLQVTNDKCYLLIPLTNYRCAKEVNVCTMVAVVRFIA